MTQPRFLTLEEAALIQHAAEDWLRLREVEFNAGEYAAALLAVSAIRQETCPRQDIASLDRTILLVVPGEPEPIPITLVRPREEDLWRGQVSIVTDLGLACIGQVVGSDVRIPHGTARFVGFAQRDVPHLHASLEHSHERA